MPISRRLAWGLAGTMAVAALTVPAAQAADTLEAIDRIGRTIAAEKCERPLELKVSFVRNPQVADISDEMQSIACRGWRIAIYRSLAPAPPRELPMSVVVEAAHPRVAAAWSVGATPAQVHAALGPPLTSRGESFSYRLGSDPRGQDRLDFEVRDGIVRAVTWTWDVD
jgi:hypothetical protein